MSEPGEPEAVLLRALDEARTHAEEAGGQISAMVVQVSMELPARGGRRGLAMAGADVARAERPAVWSQHRSHDGHARGITAARPEDEHDEEDAATDLR